MSEESARMRLKLGAIEVEYEGSASFLKDGLVNLMQEAVNIYSANFQKIHGAAPSEQPSGQETANPTSSFDHSTNTIATHLGAKSGSDLAIAAAAHLTFVKKLDKFTRRDIDNQMKEATTHYSQNMSSNLTKSLNTLVKGKRLNQVGKDTYALSAAERNALESKIDQPL